jgi:hypothetical protein
MESAISHAMKKKLRQAGNCYRREAEETWFRAPQKRRKLRLQVAPIVAYDQAFCVDALRWPEGGLLSSIHRDRFSIVDDLYIRTAKNTTERETWTQRLTTASASAQCRTRAAG